MHFFKHTIHQPSFAHDEKAQRGAKCVIKRPDYLYWHYHHQKMFFFSRCRDQSLFSVFPIFCNASLLIYIQKVNVWPSLTFFLSLYRGCEVNIVYIDRSCFPLGWICVFPRRSVWGLLTTEILLHGDNTDTAVIKGSINTWKMDFYVYQEFMLSDFGTNMKQSVASNTDKMTSKFIDGFGELCDSIWHFLIYIYVHYKRILLKAQGAREMSHSCQLMCVDCYDVVTFYHLSLVIERKEK